MSSEAKKYTLTLLQEEYTIITDEPEQQVFQAVTLLDSLMKEIAEKSNGLDTQKIAVLTALQCANKLIAREAFINELSEREQDLINAIDREMQSLL